MAYSGDWTTKEDVLNDIAKATGASTSKGVDLDSSYFVVGDVPPPRIREREDTTELELLFGGATIGEELDMEGPVNPDLDGIWKMLRMVEAFNDEKDKKAREGLQDTDSVIAITKPSKLNPNVPEFKPRGFTSPSHSRYRNNYKKSPVKHKSNCSSNKDSNVVVQNVDVKTEEIQMQDEIKGKPIIHADENEYATTLKKQISDAAKSNSHEVKKQKNVAIATLLSLYANKDTEAGSTAPLKLMKPEYFEGKVEIPAEKAQKPLETISTVTSSTPEPKLTSTTLGTNSTLNVSASTSCGSPKTKLDPETKKSIFKVNKWLGEPTERKSPAPYLGPIEFKRKERKIICKSPSSDSALRPPKPDVQSQKYQPSQYAADLQKRYKERQKALESKQKEVTWDNLEEVLKQKDLAMKKRLEQAEQEPALTSDT